MLLALRVEYLVALAMTSVTVVSLALALTAVPDDVPDPFSSDLIADR